MAERGLDRHEPHVLPIYSLSNRFCIEKVVLVGLHKRLYELSWDQLHIMALLSQGAAEEASTRTCLYPDQGSLHVGGEGDELLRRRFVASVRCRS
jgi:hypothetical protein